MDIEPEGVDLVVRHETSVRPRHHRAQYSTVWSDTVSQPFSKIGFCPVADCLRRKVRAQQVLGNWNSTGQILEMAAFARASRGQVIPIYLRRSSWNCRRTWTAVRDFFRGHQREVGHEK